MALVLCRSSTQGGVIPGFSGSTPRTVEFRVMAHLKERPSGHVESRRSKSLHPTTIHDGPRIGRHSKVFLRSYRKLRQIPATQSLMTSLAGVQMSQSEMAMAMLRSQDQFGKAAMAEADVPLHAVRDFSDQPRRQPHSLAHKVLRLSQLFCLVWRSPH